MDAFGSAQGAVDSLLGTLASVIRDEARLLGNVRGDVQFIKDEMESMNGFLLHVYEASEDDDHQLRAWKKQVRDVAVDSERWVQRYQQLAGTTPRGGSLLGYLRRIPHFVLTMSERHGIATKIQELKTRAHEVGERRQRYGVEVPPKKDVPVQDRQAGRGGGDETEEQQYARRRCLEDPKEPDITEEDKSNMIRWLTEEGSDIPRLRLIRVVGIGGLGKERLRSKVVCDASIARHFDRVVWVTVHPENDTSLQGIVEQLNSELERYGEQHEGQPPDKLSRHLKDRRFLIVFDGIYNPMTWTILRTILDHCGSPDGNAMIVITQQLEYFGSSSDERTILKAAETVMFYVERAVTLVDKTDGSQDQMVQVLQDIMVNLAPGYFYSKLLLHLLYVKPNRTLEQLQCLCASLRGFGGESNNSRQMLLFCYNDLPNDYRNCLLYLSIFPPGCKIRSTSLVRRWVVEGLITRRAGLSAPDAAERCFNALLDRGLLRCLQLAADGKAKFVGVPDQVLQFIVEIARSENFVDLNLPPDLAPYLSIGNGIQLQRVPKERKYHDCCSGILRSIICSCKHGVPVPAETEPDPPHPIVALLASLPMLERNGLLKVLDLEFCKGFQKQHLKNICQISELRYLNLRGTDVTKLPEEIDKLQNLETVDIRQTKVKVLPAKTVYLRKLKHLLSGNIKYQPKEDADALGSNESFSAVTMAHGIGSMTEMQILSHVEVSCDSVKSADDFDKLIGNFERLQKLRKLGVVIHGKTEPHLHNALRAIEKLDRCLRSLSIHFKAQGEEDNTSDSTNMITLPKFLQSIRLSGFRDGLPSCVLKLKELVKITLQDTLLKNSDLRTLGKLASLCCLRVQFITSCEENIEESNLVLGKDEFQNLKFLFLEHTIITGLSFDQGAAPKLEDMIWSYSQVKSLSGINGLTRLKEICFYGSIVSNEVKHTIAVHPNPINVSGIPLLFNYFE